MLGFRLRNQPRSYHVYESFLYCKEHMIAKKISSFNENFRNVIVSLYNFLTRYDIIQNE